MSSDYTVYAAVPIEKQLSFMSMHYQKEPEYVINRLSTKYDSYQGYISRSDPNRRRLSSTGEGSGDSSTTTSGSSYGEREDGSDGRTESDETEREEGEERQANGQVTEHERQQVETFFRGLKTQVGLN